MPPRKQSPTSYCPICGKEFKRLGRHLQYTHKLVTASSTPSTLKDFLRVCQAFPFTNKEWHVVLENTKTITDYTEKDIALPAEIFSTCYQVFERYRSLNKSQLILSQLHPLQHVSPPPENQ